jgi:tetratricopeptide (TPR) repeat protein
MDSISEETDSDKFEQAKNYFLLGMENFEKGTYIEAERFLFLALNLLPDRLSTLNNLSAVLIKLGKLEKALEILSKGINLYPTDATLYLNFGNLHEENKNWLMSLDSYDRAIEINPDYAKAFYNRGNVLQELKLVEKAIASYDKAIEIKPDYAEAYSNRGNMLQELKLVEEAIASYDKAIEIKPDYAEAYSNRGYALQKLKRMGEAIASYDKAIEIKPDYAEAYLNKSLALLTTGDLITGWEVYEWRWKNDKITYQNRNFTQPLWLGFEDIAEKTILLHAEQGLGDSIQFCRYAKLVKERGAYLVLEVPKELLGLLKGLYGIDKFVSKGKALPAFDYHCPLMSLPLAFKTTLTSIPNKIPYVRSNINNQNMWQERIGERGFKIAICWQGSTKGKVDVGRSFPVSLFEGLARLEGVRLISLQKNEGVEQLKSLPVGMSIETLPDDFDSGENAFLDSAAVMKCVDLVITSDTALTHLAGALGVKTWLPLKYLPDWRWMLDRSDSPWYPNHRLFRQTTSGDWISVFKEMENELRFLLSTKLTIKQ